MAVKKLQKEAEVKVETPVVDEKSIEEVKVEETQKEAEISVDATINEDKKPENKVKIRMRTDHKCTIGGELYQLEAGKTYTVPDSVKKILNKAGLLSPL